YEKVQAPLFYYDNFSAQSSEKNYKSFVPDGYNGNVKAFSLDTCQSDPCDIIKNRTIRFKMEFVTSKFTFRMHVCKDTKPACPIKAHVPHTVDVAIKPLEYGCVTYRLRNISPEFSSEQMLLRYTENQHNNRLAETVSSCSTIRTVSQFSDKIMTSYRAQIGVREDSCEPNFH
ncbi:hypothetical protein T265_15350, partial [Opisthorchis viverrini]